MIWFHNSRMFNVIRSLLTFTGKDFLTSKIVWTDKTEPLRSHYLTISLSHYLTISLSHYLTISLSHYLTILWLLNGRILEVWGFYYPEVSWFCDSAINESNILQSCTSILMGCQDWVIMWFCEQPILGLQHNRMLRFQDSRMQGYTESQHCQDGRIPLIRDNPGIRTSWEPPWFWDSRMLMSLRSA